MIAGPRFAEGRVLALAHAFEQATDFHTKKAADSPRHSGAAARDDGRRGAGAEEKQRAELRLTRRGAT